MREDYEAQAQEFLDKFELEFKAKFAGHDAPPWGTKGPHGDHYAITIQRRGTGHMLHFPFWGSYHDKVNGKAPTPYGVLACVSSDIYCPEDFDEFCQEYGYNNDSIKDQEIFEKASEFTRELLDFFSPEEIEALSEIQ